MKLRNKKTGDAVYVDFQIPLSNSDKGLGSYSVTSLKALNESFEDYITAEPLIKDEKIRKAVRAWADGNNIESVHYDAFWRGFRRDNSSITVWEELPLEDNKVYTIAELCGEEEE